MKRQFYLKLLTFCLFLTVGQEAMPQTAESGNEFFGYANCSAIPDEENLTSEVGETTSDARPLKSPRKAEGMTFFYANTAEGIRMLFSVVSKEEKTCQVGGPNLDKENYYYYAVDSLTSGTITIPQTANGYKVIGIETLAFKNHRNITKVNIPSTITYINEQVFYGCSSLTSVTIPNSVTKIGKYAFYDCTGLQKVIVPDIAAWCGITFGNNYANPLDRAHHLFSDENTEIKDLVIPNGVTTINFGAFYGCSGLTSVTMPNSVTTINKSAFSRCSGLTNISIPSSITSIGQYVFAYCDGLTDFYCLSNNIPTTESNAFESTNTASATLHVPVAAVSSYKNSTPWSGFGIIMAIGEEVNTETIEIATADDLKNFSNRVNAGETSLGAKLTADIEISILSNTMIGIKKFYRGEFDGAGHTIKLILRRSSDNAALFGYLSGYVHDLTTEGTITTSAKFAAGIAACTTNATIERCQSRVKINSSVNGDGTHGGIVGVSNEGSVIRDCLFSGSIIGSQTTSCGGVSGWAGGTTHISNCLVTSSRISISKTTSDLLCRNSPNVISTNNYFQGTWNAANDCGVTVLTEEQVKSGEACYKLNADRTNNKMVWYQTLDEDEFPVPDNRHLAVKFVDGAYTNGPKYTITFDTNGGSPIESITKCAGIAITPPENPTREGYTFMGWKPAIPETMPANNLTCVAQWQVNNYTLTYMVDGEVYKTVTIAYGTEITPEPAPVKEGYTFSGWSYIPSTMPATDVVVMGTFTINSYTLTYMVDGEEYKSETLVYGTEIVPEAEPSKEGYTFSGWSEIPATMPAQDVVVTGSFTVNSYTLSYIVDGEVYKTYEVEYGTVITPEAEPIKAGYTFSGWSEIPETMPAHDVEVTGFFTMILATGIALDKESLLFNSIEAQKLNVTLTPDDLYNNTVAWSSTDTEVATVDEDGLVMPVGNGEAYIIVSTTDGTDLEARCMVTVDFKAATLSLDKEEVTFAALESLKLNASVTPDNASQEVTWSSSNVSVVSVDEAGTITPLRNGEATITATTTDGTDLTATCKVTVDIPSLFEVAVTQTTLTIQGKSDTSEARNIKATIEGEEYDLGDEGKLTGLAPGRAYHIEVTADIEGYTWTEELDVTMAEIAVNFDCKTSPTTLDISVSYDAGDATVTGASFEGEEDVSTLNLIGLEPAQTYSFTYTITTVEGGTYTYNTQLQTEALSLKVTRTKVVAVGDVVVVASSNITEEENVNVGFEWRRYDWPDEIETKTGAAYIYAGTIEGSIKNLNADRFWKIRPYFLSQAGNRFLGDWVTIDPSDVSYFEPSVHTYNSISVEGNTAEVKGFVMQGSDDVESQGFMYWEASPVPSQGGVKRAQAIPANAKIVKANGNMMVASLENLEFETQYCYVAFAKTSEGETFYGEQQMFTTGEMDPDGIKDIEHSPLNIEHSEGAVYNLAGQKMVNGQPSMVNGKMPKGINIIRHSDGTSKKVLVK